MQSPSFNVTIVQPHGYIHSMALREAAEYIHAMLLATDHSSVLTTNQIIDSNINIVFCAHLLKAEDAIRLPANSIIFNSEQLDNEDGWYFKTGVYKALLCRHHIWDYSRSNLEKIPHHRKSFIPFGHSSALIRKNIRRRPGNSLLFYGVLTPRREKIIQQIMAAGVPVKSISNQYGFERDVKLFRSWAVLNLHNSDDTRAFEQIRCFYPLTNQIPIISENTPDDSSREPFEKSVFFFDLKDIAKGCSSLFNNPASFATQAQAMLQNFVDYPVKTAFEQAITEYHQPQAPLSA